MARRRDSHGAGDRNRDLVSDASPGGAGPDKPRMYELPARLRVNEWALAGDWTVRKEAAVLHKVNGGIAYRFHARDLHLVMGPAAPGTSGATSRPILGRPGGGALARAVGRGAPRPHRAQRVAPPLKDGSLTCIGGTPPGGSPPGTS